MAADHHDAPPPAHDWVSLVVDDVTWLFDVSFLTSSWRCAWGAGCPGVRGEAAPERGEGCCSYGAHFADEADQARVAHHAAELPAELWELGPLAAEQGGAFDTDADGAAVTRIVDDRCVFLNRPDFPGGAGCALHLGALAAGERPLDWKPEVCWQLPLRLEHHVDDNGRSTMMLRNWTRHDWGAGGDDFHWWCTEDDLAFDGSEPLYESMADEISELTGTDVYARLVDHLAQPRSRPVLPHPGSRRPSRS